MIDLQLSQLIQAARAVLNQVDNGELFVHQDPALANTCAAFDQLSSCVSSAEIELQQHGLNKGATITLLDAPDTQPGFTAKVEFHGKFDPMQRTHKIASSLIGELGIYGRPQVDVFYNVPAAITQFTLEQRLAA